MKYRVGDKFILEIQGVRNEEYHEYPYETEIDYNSEGELDKLQMLVNGVDTYSYNKGAEDAWELTKLIITNYDKGGLKLTELREVFGTHNINNILVIIKSFHITFSPLIFYWDISFFYLQLELLSLNTLH